MQFRRALVRALVLVLSLSSLACQTKTAEPLVPPEQLGVAWMRTELYFGRVATGMTDAEAVNEESWDRFLAEVVTPRFPAGLTVLDATGQWRDGKNGQLVREPTKVMILLHPPDPATQQMIEEVAAEYARRFGPDAVLRVTAPARVKF